MLPGPVFQVELITASRRRRYYFFRVCYALALLILIWQVYSNSPGYSGGPQVYSPTRMSQLAKDCFEGFTWIQGITVLFLTPAFFSGVIADERQRKTLHYLLASQLTGSEIVLGKLMARFLHVAVILALGLPVMSLLSLFGGIDPWEVALTCLGTFTTALMIAAISVAVSAVSKRPRDAIVSSYLISAIWLFGPLLFWMLVRSNWAALAAAIEPIVRILIASTPFGLADGPGLTTMTKNYWANFAWMVGLQLLIASLIVGMATVRLRPSFRNEGARRRILGTRLRVPRPDRVRLRSGCGDDPMIWKERHGVRMGRLARGATIVVAIGILVGLAWALYEWTPSAFEELLTYGYGYSFDNDGANGLNGVVRGFSVTFYVLVALGVASAAAAGVAGEKEQDTWISLISTDLSGEEILRAKMFGPIWSVRWFIGCLILLLIFGLVLGALHPFGLIAVLSELAIYLWFAAALGTFMSLRCRNTTRALAWTIGIMIFLNGGYLFLLMLFYSDSPAVLFACSPATIGVSAASFNDVWQIMGFNTNPWSGTMTRDQNEYLVSATIGLILYLTAAIILTHLSFAKFDEWIDRPRRRFSIPRPVITLPEPA
jgi:ABC-type transport system involved in multi-copper enzyme maturation permease subunit